MSKKKKVIHVDQLIVKANEVIIMDEDRKRHRDPWFGILRGDRHEVEDKKFKNDFNDEFKDDDIVDEIEDKKEDIEDIVEERRRPRWI